MDDRTARSSSRGFPGGPVALVALAPLVTVALVFAGVGLVAAGVVSAVTLGLATYFLAARSSERDEARYSALSRELTGGKEQAEARESLLRALVEATPSAVLFYADAGLIRFANGEARRLFFEGASPEGQNFLRLVAEAPEGLRRALLGDTDELFNVELEGQRETYHLSRRTLQYDGETHTLLLVRQLTFEISRREVDVLRKVIRIISHELNNSLAPIASLIHSARLIAKNPAHLDKLDRVFDTVEERALHLSTFLNGYATLARLPKPRPAEAPWTPLLDRVRALYPVAQVADAPGARGYFDAAQVEQVVINLLKNAMEAGGDPASVQLAALPEPDGATTVMVSDRGKGLSAEALESAFLPLYSTKEKGSGMGLALCREIAEAHAGRISLRNRQGGGCTVSLFLPAQRKPGGDTGKSRATLTLTRS